MSLSIIPKLNKIRGNGFNNKLTDDIKNRIIGIICLYSFNYIFTILPYFFEDIINKISDFCKQKSHKTERVESEPNYIISSKIRNDDDKISTTSRNKITSIRESNNTTTNHVVLLSNILPEQIYKNIKSFIELGKGKLSALEDFYIEMQFDGLTDRDIIKEEILSIVIVVGEKLGDVFDDKIVKALIESGSEEHIMLLLHYIFPFIVAVIRAKIEKGIYKKSSNSFELDMTQVLTQIERKIELDEQGNIKLSFRISKQVSQVPLEILLNT